MFWNILNFIKSAANRQYFYVILHINYQISFLAQNTANYNFTQFTIFKKLCQ